MEGVKRETLRILKERSEKRREEKRDCVPGCLDDTNVGHDSCVTKKASTRLNNGCARFAFAPLMCEERHHGNGRGGIQQGGNRVGV